MTYCRTGYNPNRVMFWFCKKFIMVLARVPINGRARAGMSLPASTQSSISGPGLQMLWTAARADPRTSTCSVGCSAGNAGYAVCLPACVASRSRTSALDKRLQVWTKLSTYTQGLPARNQLLVLGDFNCCLSSHSSTTSGGMTGPGLLKPQTMHPDCQYFFDYVSQQGLCGLNTWTSHHRRPMATHENGTVSAQIDSFSRRVHADCISGQAAPVRRLNLTPWRGGSQRIALVATLPVHPGWRTGRQGSHAAKPGQSFQQISAR